MHDSGQACLCKSRRHKTQNPRPNCSLEKMEKEHFMIPPRNSENVVGL